MDAPRDARVHEATGIQPPVALSVPPDLSNPVPRASLHTRPSHGLSDPSREAHTQRERDAKGSSAGEPQPRNPDPLIGKVIADRYRIVSPLGKGGMGVVYKVEHLRIGKLMAIKLLTGELSRNRDVVRRFKREALAASRLTSINTVQVWDFGHSDGLTYLVMELVDGDDFGKVLRKEGPLPFQRVAKIAVQACNSMIEAHARGIVHRDLKPENLIILATGGSELQDLVKVLDFGLAKVHEDERPNTNDITTAGAIVGTPFYMAPEQIRGEVVDGRADVYALGAVMYRAITGTPPFQAPVPMAVLTMHLTEPLVPPHERAPELGIPQDASEIIGKAMMKDPKDRYPDAIALRDALIAYLGRTGMSGGFLRSGNLEAVAAADIADITASRSLVPGVPIEHQKPATRKEVVEYSRRMRRNMAILGALLVAAVVVAVWMVVSLRASIAKRHQEDEAEPNDDLTRATPLMIGTPIKAQIGRRLAVDSGDVDLYSLDVPKGDDGDRALLEIDLGALPNMPLCVSLIDSESAPPLGTFCRPRGRALHVAAFAVAAGRHYLRVEQDRSVDATGERPPVYENVSDLYSLRVALAARTAELEIEPNDTLAAPQPIAVGQSVNAQIAWNGDVDTYCLATPSGGPRARFVVMDHAMSRADGARLVVEPLVGGVAQPRVTVAPMGSTAPQPGDASSVGPYLGAPFDAGGPTQCISVRLLRPEGAGAAPASASGADAPYQVMVEKS